MIRKLLSGLLAGLLTVSLCACGGDDTRGEDSQREAQVSETDRNGEQAQEQETQGQGDAGKDIYLFCSHGTGGLAGSVEDISAALPDSNVSDNIFDVYEEDAPSAREELLDWLSGIGF